MAAKKVLGRGLGALIDDSKYEKKPEKEAVSTNAIAEIDIDKIETNPFQPRKEFNQELLQELSDSIKELGIIQPITVKKINNNKYQIISGERRYRASKLANKKKIIAFIRDADDQGLLEMALVENIQRDDLNSIEVAVSYQRLADECDLTQEKLSKRVGKKRATVANYLRLLKLPAEIQVGVRDNKIQMGHARALLTVENPESQKKLYYKIINEGLSVRNIETLIREINYPINKENIKPTKSDLPKNYLNFKNSLNEVLNTKIDLKKNENGTGNIIISFKSNEDFERIKKILEKK